MNIIILTLSNIRVVFAVKPKVREFKTGWDRWIISGRRSPPGGTSSSESRVWRSWGWLKDLKPEVIKEDIWRKCNFTYPRPSGTYSLQANNFNDLKSCISHEKSDSTEIKINMFLQLLGIIKQTFIRKTIKTVVLKLYNTLALSLFPYGFGTWILI